MVHRATKQQLVEAIHNRLISRIDRLTAWNCLISERRQPATWPTDTVCVIFRLQNGRFPPNYMAGGGLLTPCEQLSMDITVWLRQWTQSTPNWEMALLGHEGLISYWKPAVLRALLVTEAADGTMIPWQPVDAHGDRLWRNPLVPTQSSAPVVDGENSWLGLTITFTCDYDWWL